MSLRKTGKRLYAICKPGLWPTDVQSLPTPSCIIRTEEAAVIGGIDDAWFASMSGELAHCRAVRLRQAAHCQLPSLEPILPIDVCLGPSRPISGTGAVSCGYDHSIWIRRIYGNAHEVEVLQSIPGRSPRVPVLSKYPSPAAE